MSAASDLAAPRGDALEVRDVSVTYRRGRTRTLAVDRVALTVGYGQTVGVVGESGSGKTSLSRAILGLVQPTSGSIALKGQDITKLRGARRRELAADLQVVFQDPYSSLDPAQTVGAALVEPLMLAKIKGAEARTRVAAALHSVGLDAEAAERYPRQFSGGQRQRIAVARAIMLRPGVVICDEAVSALDLSVQAQIVNLLLDLQDQFDLSYLFIAHDLSVVRHLCERIYVMYRGQVVESGATADVYSKPAHPYTQALLAAAPVPDPGEQRARREARVVQSIGASARPSGVGCPFADRCPFVLDICRQERPALQARVDGGAVACHRYPEVAQ